MILSRLRRFTFAFALALSAVIASCSSIPKDAIPRKALFHEWEKTRPRLSPDGTKLAYIGIYKGASQLFVKDLERGEERMIDIPRWELRRGLSTYFWHVDSKRVFYWHDDLGDENYHLYSLELGTGNLLDLAPFKASRVELLSMSRTHPDEILVLANADDRSIFDVYRVNLREGKVHLEFKNPGNVVDWVVDRDLEIKELIANTLSSPDDKGIRVKNGSTGEWESLKGLPKDFSFSTLNAASPDGRRLWLKSRFKSNTLRLLELDVATRAIKTVAEDSEFDIESGFYDPDHTRVDAVLIEREKPSWILFASVRSHFKEIREKLKAEPRIVSQDVLRRYWVVKPISDVIATSYYLYDLQTKKLELLFREAEALSQYALSEMVPIRFKARDGMLLHGYLTRPRAAEKSTTSQAGPTVLLVHGGPWVRDTWGYDAEVQWLASRGYNVLQVNYRASTGFGEKYYLAGAKQWGLKMTDDLIDAKNWAVEQGIADPRKVCIVGASYGGYAVFSALTRYPDDFACGIAGSGISDLLRFWKDIPPYWRDSEWKLNRMLGNPKKDKDLLKESSPVHHTRKLKAPLLIYHGKNDPRTRTYQSERFYQAAKKHDKPVEYRLMPEVGHSLPPYMLYRIERFLHDQIGGTYEDADTYELRSDESE